MRGKIFFKRYHILYKIMGSAIIIIYCLLGIINNSFAQEKLDSVKVARKSFPPFVFEEGGQYVGFSIDLWKEIAKELNLDYQIYEEDSIVNLLTSIQQGNTDIGIAGITMTSEREKPSIFLPLFIILDYKF